MNRSAQILLMASAVQPGSTGQAQAGRKRAVNVTIDEKILAEAKQLGINLSQTLETALRELIKAALIKEWSTTNQKAIASYNTLVTPPETKP